MGPTALTDSDRIAYRCRELLRLSPVTTMAYALLVVALLYHLASYRTTVELLALGGAALVLAALPLLFGQMLVEVTAQQLSVRYGYAKWLGRDIPLDDVARAEVVSYRPIRDFGGWGIRCARFDSEWTACYTFRGKRAVVVTLKEPIRFGRTRVDRLLIGSDEPERLQQAIEPVRETRRDSLRDLG